MMNVICEEFGSTSRGKAWCGTWVMLREVVGLYELQPTVKSTLGVSWKITRATRLRVREVQLGRYMALGDATVGVALRGHMSSRKELEMES